MANKLNVLVGAELASNVTRELNKEIEKLKLEDTEVGLKIKSGSAKKLENEVAETLADVLSHKKIYKKMPPGLGADIGDIIADGIKKSFGVEISDELDKQIKKIVKKASEDAKKYSLAFLEGEKLYSEQASYFRENKRDINKEREWIKIHREAQRLQKESKIIISNSSREWKAFSKQIDSNLAEMRRLEEESNKLDDLIIDASSVAEKNKLISQSEDLGYEIGYRWTKAKELEKKRDALLLSKSDAYDIAYKNINDINDSVVDGIDNVDFDRAFIFSDTRKIIEAQKEVDGLTDKLKKLDTELHSLGTEDNNYANILKEIEFAKSELEKAKVKFYNEISSYEKYFAYSMYKSENKEFSDKYIKDSIKTRYSGYGNSEIEKVKKKLEESNEVLDSYRENINAINNQSDEDIKRLANEITDYYYDVNKSQLYRAHPNDPESREKELNEVRKRQVQRLTEEREQTKKYYIDILAEEEARNESLKLELDALIKRDKERSEQKQTQKSLFEKTSKEQAKTESKDVVLDEHFDEKTTDKIVEAEKKIEEAKESEKKVTEGALESKKQELDVTEDLAKKVVESEDKIQEASKETTEQQKKSAEQEAKVAEESAKKIVRAEKEKQDEIEKTSDEYKDAVKTFKSVYGDDGSLKQQTTKYDFKDGITETVDTFYRTKKDGSIGKEQLVTVSDKTQELAYQDAQKANKELEKSVRLASEFEEKISGLYNKEFVDVDQLIPFENAFDEIIDDIEKYQDNADGLIKIQERLNKLIKETNMAESAANSKANEQASAEKTERAKELRNSISAYNTLRKTVDDLYKYAGNFHIFDEEDAKRIISFENDLEDLYSIIKKDTASIEDLALAQKLLNEMQSKADSHASSLKNRSNQYDEETKERIAAENKLRKEYDETKKKAEDARKVVASSLESAKNILGGNAIHNDELTKLQEELIQIGNILDKDDAKVEELEDALRRLNNIRLNIDTRLGFEEKLNRELEKIESNLDVKSTKLRSRFGDLFDENELRLYWDFTKNINEELRKEKPNWANISRLIEQAKQKTSKFEAKLAASAKELKQIEDDAKVFDSSLGRFIQFYGFGELFRVAKTGFTHMFEQIKLVDSSMVELRKVTEETDVTYQKFLDNSAEKAKTLGVTMTDYIDSVTNFARMDVGGFEAAQQVAETANIFQQVSENLTADQASEYLISNMKAWGYQANETIEIVDILNNLSNKYAITIDGLGESLTRSSAAMMSANNTLEQTAALTIAANNVIQDPLVVGNALKTVSMRLRGTKTDEDEDGDTVMEAGALRNLIYNATKGTTGGPVDIVNANNEFKSTYDILLDISKVWKELDDMTKATLLEKIAGKHRASVVSALLNDAETLEDAYADALQSAGSATEEFEKRTKSIEYHLQQLYAAFQELSTNAASVEFVTDIIDGLRWAIESLNEIGISNVFASLSSILLGLGYQFKAVPFLEGIGEEAKAKGESIKVLGKSIDLFTMKSSKAAGAVKLLVSAIKGLGKGSLIGIAGFALGKIFGAAFDYFEEYENREDNALDEVNNLSNKLSNLNSEYKFLSEKEDITDVEKERLSVLEDEIALQEADLELSKQRLAEINSDKYTHIKTTKPLFGESTKVIDQSQTADELLAENIGDATGNYAEAKATISELREERKKYSEQLKNSTSGEHEYQEALVKLSSINKQLISENEKLTNSQNSIKTNYENLLVQEEELVNVTENSVGLTDDEIDAYKEKLNMTRSDIELHKILLGLEDANQEYAKKQLAAYESYKTASNIIAKLNDGHSITKEELEALKKEYPNLTGVTEEYGEGAEASYTISKEALETLAETQATSLSQMNNNEIARTITARDEALNRIRIYKMEMAAIAQVAAAQGMISDAGQQLDTEADQSGSMMDRLKWAAYMTQTAEASNLSSMISGTITETQNQLDTANAELNALEQALKDFAAGKNPLDNGNGDPTGDGKGPGSGDGDKVDLWDKYANAIDQINQKLEEYNRNIEDTESALELNQSYEERNIDLMSEEIQLYDQLINQYAEKSVAQQEALASTNSLLDEMYARLYELTGVDMSNMTQAEMEKWFNTNLSKKQRESIKGQEIEHLIGSIATARDTQHEWNNELRDTAAQLNELSREQINVQINFHSDMADKFEESRANSESLLDILEEIEGTESQRLSIIDTLIDSYDTELTSTLQMHESIGERLVNLAKENKQNTDEYNLLLEESNNLEQHGLDIIKEQHDMRLKQLEVEKQRAIANAEASIYGEEGQDAWEKSRQREIDRLQNQLDALEEDTSEADYLEQLSEKEEHIAELEEKLANLRNQKTIQQLKQQEDGSFQWEYVEDQRAINETMEELEDARNDLQKTKDDKALQDQKDAIQDRIDSIEDEIDSKQEQYDLELEQINAHYEAQKAAQEQFTQEQIDLWLKHVTDVRQALDTLETQTRKGLDEVTSETAKGMSNLQDAYNESFINITSDLSSFVDAAIREFNRLEAARRAAAEEARAMTEGAVGGSTSSPPKAAGGIKFVEANNFLARLHYGERVLTRQEASQYNELEDDIKSGKLQSYFDSLQEDTALSISNVAATSVAKSATVPTVGSAVTSFVIEHLELPQVKDPTDFAAVINEWARGEFGGLAQKARIIPAR